MSTDQHQPPGPAGSHPATNSLVLSIEVYRVGLLIDDAVQNLIDSRQFLLSDTLNDHGLAREFLSSVLLPPDGVPLTPVDNSIFTARLVILRHTEGAEPLELAADWYPDLPVLVAELPTSLAGLVARAQPKPRRRRRRSGGGAAGRSTNQPPPQTLVEPAQSAAAPAAQSRPRGGRRRPRGGRAR